MCLLYPTTFSLLSTPLEVCLYGFKRLFHYNMVYCIIPYTSYWRKISQIFLPRTSNGDHQHGHWVGAASSFFAPLGDAAKYPASSKSPYTQYC